VVARRRQGTLQSKAVETHRNRLVMEKKEFFEQRDSGGRSPSDEAIGPREAVREHPELAGTYLNLRAAELASKTLRDSQIPMIGSASSRRFGGPWQMTSSAASRCGPCSYENAQRREE
jgi:hypothetical protein